MHNRGKSSNYPAALLFNIAILAGIILAKLWLLPLQHGITITVSYLFIGFVAGIVVGITSVIFKLPALLFISQSVVWIIWLVISGRMDLSSILLGAGSACSIASLLFLLAKVLTSHSKNKL